jgi:hypothetical protein
LIDILMLLAFLVFVSAGFRAKYSPVVKEGSAIDRKFERVVVGGNLLAVPVATAMPLVVPGSNAPALAYAGAYCVVVALLLYPVTHQDRLMQVAHPRGRRAKPFSEQAPLERRLPYRLTYLLGYWLVGGYVYLNSGFVGAA